MPSHAFFFIHNFLNKFRLKFDWTEEMIDGSVGSPGKEDYDAQQESDYFSEHIKSCGYHYSWFNNLFIIFFTTCLIFVIWLIVLVKDCLSKRVLGRKSKNERFMANFCLRFFYEVIFEICLCTVIYLSFAQKANSIVLFLCIITVITILLSLFFCLSRSCKNGPYIRECYEAGTLMQSFWAVRPIQYDRIESIQQSNLQE